jgi:hypothetical protein
MAVTEAFARLLNAWTALLAPVMRVLYGHERHYRSRHRKVTNAAGAPEVRHEQW